MPLINPSQQNRLDPIQQGLPIPIMSDNPNDGNKVEPVPAGHNYIGSNQPSPGSLNWCSVRHGKRLDRRTLESTTASPRLPDSPGVILPTPHQLSGNQPADQHEQLRDHSHGLSLQLLQQDESSFMSRVEDAVRETICCLLTDKRADLSLYKHGSASAVIKFIRGESCEFVIKVYFGLHSDNAPPNEVAIMTKLKQVPNTSRYWNWPEYLGSFYSQSVQSWLSCIGWYPASLADVIVQYPQGLSEPMARSCIRELLKVLKALNAQSIMLCDIKPKYILLSSAAMEAISNSGTSLPYGSLVIGNYRHTRLITSQDSAERRGRSHKEEAVDVRSVGMLFYQLLTGKPYSESIELLNQAGNVPPPAITKCQQKRWKKWSGLSKQKSEYYPMGQWQELFRSIYCCPSGMQTANSDRAKLSRRSFFALCDLLRSPEAAQLQLKKHYWSSVFQCNPGQEDELKKLKRVCRTFRHAPTKKQRMAAGGSDHIDQLQTGEGEGLLLKRQLDLLDVYTEQLQELNRENVMQIKELGEFQVKSNQETARLIAAMNVTE